MFKRYGLSPGRACALWVLACLAGVSQVSASYIGTPHPGMSYNDLALAHDPSLGSIIAADYFVNAGPAVSFGSTTANPGTKIAKIGEKSLASAFGIDPPGDYGISDFKATTEVMVGADRTYVSGLLLEQGGIDASKSISAGSGVFAQYVVNDPTRPNGSTVQARFALSVYGDVVLPSTRPNAVFSIGTNLLITPAEGGSPILSDSGVWQGGYNSDFVAGLYDDAGILKSSMDDNGTRTRILAGVNTWDQVLINGSTININYSSFYTLSGPPGEAADNININLGDTIELTFGAAPGFENLTFEFVPEPGSAALLVLVGAGVLGNRRMKKG